MTRKLCSTIALADILVLMTSDGAIVSGNMEDSTSALVPIFFFWPEKPFEDVQTSAECDKQ